GVLGEPERVVQRCKHHAGPELDPFGRGGERRQHLEQGGQVAVGRTVVLAHPRRVESDAFGQAHELERLPVLLPQGALRVRRELRGEQPDADADAHRADVTRPSRRSGMMPGVRITLDPSSQEPLSEQLSGAIADRIRRGSLAAGARLPTVRALAEDLGLAANTVAKAYRALEEAGLVQGRGRQGTFVAERLPGRIPERERRLADAADAFARRGSQLGFGATEVRRALDRALRGR